MGTLFYLISQGFENVWKNKIMFIASVLIISTSMITLGIFSIVGENAKAFVSNMKADQTMIAFLDEGVDEARVGFLAFLCRHHTHVAEHLPESGSLREVEFAA